MRVLVACASRHGTTSRIADTVAQELREHGHAVERAELGESDGTATLGVLAGALDRSRYDAVVVGGAVYTGTWLHTAVQAQTRLLDAGVPTAAFAVGVVDVSDQVTQPRWTALRTTESAGERVVLGGAIDRRVLSLRERSLLAVVRAREGEYTRWDDVRAWAREVAVTLGAAAAAPTGSPAPTRPAD